MKVKTFLNKLMMSSSVDMVRIEKDGYTKVEYDCADLRLNDYGFWGNATVKTFRIYDKVLIIVLLYACNKSGFVPAQALKKAARG